MRKLWYMGLEPYKARYTLQLQEWNRAVFERRGINYSIVPGLNLDKSQKISVGQVLYESVNELGSYDATRRSHQ